MTDRWDEFSKSLAEKTVPRRQSLRLLGAALAGALLSPLGLGTAWAGGRDPCKAFCRCSNKSRQDACLAACNACNKDTNRLCGDCRTGFACCSTSEDCCSGYCTNPANDFDNCGACGAPCDYPGPYEDGACVDGHCFYSCVPGAVDCGDGGCTPLWADPNNCGACGNACPETAPICLDGVCSQNPCLNPSPDYCHGVCTNTSTDWSNCGACGHECVGFDVCIGGNCENIWPIGWEF